MRALFAISAACLLAACTSTSVKSPNQNTTLAQAPSALDQARAKNQHWLEPNLLQGFPYSTDADYRPPARLAVLLPQTGNLAIAAKAIRDGLVSAYYAEYRTKPSLRFYDSKGTADGAKDAYQRALKDGAQMIIGPIGKEEVAAIAGSASGVPVLVLNNVDNPKNRFLLNFSLNPEREGELIADRLIERKILSAVVFSQNTDSIGRTLSAFESRYIKSGGRVISKATAPQFSKDAGTGAAINPVLPENILQAKAVVLLMTSSAAKSTRAALALHGASALPVFASSDITDNIDTKTNGQLDGVQFLQMPWLGNGSNVLNISAAQLAKLPSARGGGSRLNAFGIDAWLISTHLQAWLNNPNLPINGVTGTLHLEPDGQIERSLPWMQYQNGLPQAANAE